MPHIHVQKPMRESFAISGGRIFGEFRFERPRAAPKNITLPILVFSIFFTNAATPCSNPTKALLHKNVCKVRKLFATLANTCWIITREPTSCKENRHYTSAKTQCAFSLRFWKAEHTVNQAFKNHVLCHRNKLPSSCIPPFCLRTQPRFLLIFGWRVIKQARLQKAKTFRNPRKLDMGWTQNWGFTSCAKVTAFPIHTPGISFFARSHMPCSHLYHWLLYTSKGRCASVLQF